jgi:steroid delta-isomerase-like uncharacterized protein
MAAESAEAVLRHWFEDVWTGGRDDLIETYLAPGAVAHGLDETGEGCVGAAGFRPFYEKLRGACPDIRIAVDDVVASGPMAACRWTATLTHTGDHLGVPATGRAVRVTGMTIARVEDGRIVEGWNEWDRLAFATELGLVVATAASAG